MSRELFEIYFYPPEEINALGRSLSELIHSVLAIDPIPDSVMEELRDLRKRIDDASARIAPHECSDRVPRTRNEDKTGVRPYFVQGGLIGEHNPFFPDVEIQHEDNVTSGTVRFEVGFEGPPGCVHGGFIALLFDGVIGYHNTELELPALTAKLDVRYLKPTPIMTDLTFEVRTTSVNERWVTDDAWLEADGQRVAEATGGFLLPKWGDYRDDMLTKIVVAS